MVARAEGMPSRRTPVQGVCNGCGSSQLEAYEVLSEGGWYQVVKCQACLMSVERAPWKPLGHVTRYGVGS
jgi:vanillate/4-hydroxybenzoate decarboxylase subunit D